MVRQADRWLTVGVVGLLVWAVGWGGLGDADWRWLWLFSLPFFVSYPQSSLVVGRLRERAWELEHEAPAAEAMGRLREDRIL